MITLMLGIVGAGTAFVFGASALLIAGGFLLGAGLGRLAMTGMEPDSSGASLSGQNVTVREPAVSRKVVYGKTRVGGALVFIDSNGDDNAFLHLVIAFAGHAITKYDEVYFGDRRVWGDEEFFLNNPFDTVSGSNLVEVLHTGTKNVGEQVVISGAANVGGLNVNGTHTITAVSGNRFTFAAGANATATVNGGGGLNVNFVRTGYIGNFAEYVELNFHDGTQTTADSNLVSRTSKWDSDNILRDTAYIYVRLKFDAEQNNQVPNVSVLMQGKKVFNPITNQTAFSSNPALCIRDYLLSDKYGLGEVASSIDAETLAIAIAKCDENVPLSDNTTEKRYSLNGVVDTAKSRKQNITNMLKCMSGQLIYSSDKYFIQPAYYQTPTVSIDESVVVGDIKIKTKQSRRQLYNGVKGTFISRENNYIVTDFPAQISSSFATSDGDPIYLDLVLPFVSTNTHAQRLARIALLQSRQQTSISVPCNLAALQFKAGDNIMITNQKMGYVDKVFEVIDYQMAFTASGEIIVNVDAMETASALYDWNTSDEEDFLTAGEISLYDGSIAQPPTSLTATNSTTINDDGTAISSLVVAWTASADVFVERYEVEWSNDNVSYSGATVNANRFEITPTIAGALYYIRVRAINNIGVKSAYATVNQSATGDTTAPAVPTGLTATGGLESITINWVNPVDKDFSHVLVQRKIAGGTFAEIASVGGGRGVAGSFTSNGLGNEETYVHRVKAVDYSNNSSAYTAGQSATTDAAIESPRNNKGYIYYTLSSANAPSTPSATSYNFDTGSFGGLTSNWQNDPIAQTGADGTFWSTSFIVTEASFGGTQTITFSTPFKSFEFDGLVTFTNLNNELADPDSSEITTIDGGLIKTGKVEADRIEIDGTSIDTQTIGGVKTLIIGGLGVTAAKLASNAVTPVKIQDLAVTEAKINNLAVGTLKLQDQAVTIPSSAQQVGSIQLGTTEANILSLTWTSTGAETEVMWAAGVSISYNQNNSVLMKLKLNNNEVQRYTFNANEKHVDFRNVTPVVGSNTISLTAEQSGSFTGNLAPIVTASAIRTLELKK